MPTMAIGSSAAAAGAVGISRSDCQVAPRSSVSRWRASSSGGGGAKTAGGGGADGRGGGHRRAGGAGQLGAQVDGGERVEAEVAEGPVGLDGVSGGRAVAVSEDQGALVPDEVEEGAGPFGPGQGQEFCAQARRLVVAGC